MGGHPADGAVSHSVGHLVEKKNKVEGFRDDTTVKRTAYSSRGSGFNCWPLRGGSQPSVTPGPGDPMPSSEGDQACMWCRVIYAGKPLIQHFENPKIVAAATTENY